MWYFQAAAKSNMRPPYLILGKRIGHIILRAPKTSQQEQMQNSFNQKGKHWRTKNEYTTHNFMFFIGGQHAFVFTSFFGMRQP